MTGPAGLPDGAGDPTPGPDAAGDTEDLFRRARGGDQVAWDRLVSRYSALLWRIARAHQLSPTDAADVVQTTWLRLVEHAGRIADPTRLGSWLATTARRECLRVQRLSRRERPHPDGHEAFEGVGTSTAPPDADLLRSERDALLWSAVASLPERSRVLLRVLMADPQPSYEEVADALGIPQGSIGPTRARSLARLRDILGDR